MKSLLLLCLVGFALAGPLQNVGSRPFQGEYFNEETPSHEVICSTAEYEVRKLHQAHWASTTVESFSRGYAQLQALKILRDYASGDNSGGTVVKIGNPILTQISFTVAQLKAFRENRSVHRRAFSIAAYLPDGSAAPEPNDKKVSLDEIPDQVIFAKDFGGLPLGGRLLRLSLFLGQALRKNQEAFDPTTVFLATYADPVEDGMVNFIPKNEVWFIASQAVSPACQREGFVDHTVETDDNNYEVVERFENGVELREYDSANFIVLTAPTSEGCKLKETVQKGLLKLRRMFIIVARFIPDWQPEDEARRFIYNVHRLSEPDEYGCKYTARLWLPFTDEERATRALSLLTWQGHNAQIVRDTQFNGYAYTFGGYFRIEGRGKKGVYQDMLDELGVRYDKNNFVIVLYNKQSQLFGRRNDIVYPAVEKKGLLNWP